MSNWRVCVYLWCSCYSARLKVNKVGLERVFGTRSGPKAKPDFVLLCFFLLFFYPVASQVSVQLVLMHPRPADLDHGAVDHLHRHVLGGSRGNYTDKKQASEYWENN